LAAPKHKVWITVIAVLGYGGWAFYSSVYDGSMQQNFAVAMRAGFIQGAYSGLLTLINITALEFMFLKLNSMMPCLANMVLTVVCATIVQYGVIVPIHIINGTPNIVLTLAPGFFIGTTFSAAYLFSVRKKHYPGV
jgi:hypothetical protein